MVALMSAETAALASRSSSNLLSGPPLQTRFTSIAASFSISLGCMLASSRLRYSVTSSNSPRSSHIPWHLGHQSIRIEDFPKCTAANFVVLHFTQGRFVEITLVFSRFSISSLSHRRDPPSARFLSFRSSSLTSHMPLHLGQPSNCIEKTVYKFKLLPHVGQTSCVCFSSFAPFIGRTSTRKSVSSLFLLTRLNQ